MCEGTYNGLKLRVRRVRLPTEGGIQKAKEVCPQFHVSLFLDTYHQQNSIFCKVEKLNKTQKVAEKNPKVGQRALMGA